MSAPRNLAPYNELAERLKKIDAIVKGIAKSVVVSVTPETSVEETAKIREEKSRMLSFEMKMAELQRRCRNEIKSPTMEFNDLRNDTEREIAIIKKYFASHFKDANAVEKLAEVDLGGISETFTEPAAVRRSPPPLPPTVRKGPPPLPLNISRQPPPVPLDLLRSGSGEVKEGAKIPHASQTMFYHEQDSGEDLNVYTVNQQSQADARFASILQVFESQEVDSPVMDGMDGVVSDAVVDKISKANNLEAESPAAIIMMLHARLAVYIDLAKQFLGPLKPNASNKDVTLAARDDFVHDHKEMRVKAIQKLITDLSGIQATLSRNSDHIRDPNERAAVLSRQCDDAARIIPSYSIAIRKIQGKLYGDKDALAGVKVEPDFNPHEKTGARKAKEKVLGWIGSKPEKDSISDVFNQARREKDVVISFVKILQKNDLALGQEQQHSASAAAPRK